MIGCRHRNGLHAAVIALAVLLKSAVCLPQPATDHTFLGVNYGPYHQEGQSPKTSANIPEDQILADLKIISAAGFRIIRSYGLDNGLSRMVPTAHHQLPHLRFFLGVYECALHHDEAQNPRSTRAQMNEAIRLSNHYRNVAGIVVGNECLAGEPEACLQPVSVEQLIEDLNYVRKGLNPEARSRVAVTTAMSMVAAVKNHDSQGRRVADHCDVVMVNIHPFFAPAAIETAVSANIDGSYRRLEQLYGHSGKSILIGETGWPSAGPPNGPAVPGLENQRTFIRDLIQYAATHCISAFIFEMFDEPWKDEAGGVGPHWGLFDRHGRAKFPMPIITPSER